MSLTWKSDQKFIIMIGYILKKKEKLYLLLPYMTDRPGKALEEHKGQ